MKKGKLVFKRYQTRSSKTGKPIYRFRYMNTGNGETVFPSHPYDSKQARDKGIALIKATVAAADVVDA